MSIDKGKPVSRRAAIQWLLVPIVVATLSLGWKYPAIGFVVPFVMLLGIAGGLFNGRYVCGHLCPRGAFFDRVMSKISVRGHIPGFLRNRKFRWGVFAALMAFMVFRLATPPAGEVYWRHMGHVFWFMCLITTGVGVLLGIAIHPRAWCAFCPIGTAASAINGGTRRLEIHPTKCRQCKVCERACPINIPISAYKGNSIVANPDCLKCPVCVAKCPWSALRWAKPEEPARTSNGHGHGNGKSGR